MTNIDSVSGSLVWLNGLEIWGWTRRTFDNKGCMLKIDLFLGLKVMFLAPKRTV